VTKPCAVCGEPITRQASQFRAVEPTCSRRCSDARRSRELVGPKSNRWRDGRNISPRGYVRVNVGPLAMDVEHRVVAAQMLGRPLLPREVVHHVNGDTTDNRPENLRVFATQGEHMRHHAEQRRQEKDRQHGV
jgi:hypothetical protein